MAVRNYAIIVAGGSGKRMRSAIPKQFLLLGNKPVLMRTVSAFAKALGKTAEIIVVLPADQINTWEKLCSRYRFTLPHKVTSGGKTRYHSVKAGLQLVKEEGTVGIHDGVRPLITGKLIRSLYKMAARKGTAIPVTELKESLRKIKGRTNKAEDRSHYRSVQTPQCFRLNILRAAFKKPYKRTFTDDAAVVENAGFNLNLMPGDFFNIKITRPEDMILAKFLLYSPFRSLQNGRKRA